MPTDSGVSRGGSKVEIAADCGICVLRVQRAIARQPGQARRIAAAARIG
jgi:hypothetical protein